MEKSHLPFEAAIFDVDGTLFQTEKVALPAFERVFEALREKGIYQGEAPSRDKMLSVFGMTIPELWETLLPGTSIDVRDQANELFAHEELGLIKKGHGELYPGVKETLQSLYDQGLRIYTASNGEERYVKTVIEEMGLADLFTRLYSAGEYKTEKKEDLVALLLQQEDVTHAVMIGDRKSDVAAGRANHLYTVGCDFGFAGEDELKDAHVVIRSFDEIERCLNERQAQNEHPQIQKHSNANPPIGTK